MAYELQLSTNQERVKVRSPWAAALLPLVTYWRGTRRIQGAARLAGQEPLNGWIALVLYLVLSVGFWAYLQVSLNSLWRREAEPLPGQPAPPEPADAMPPRLEDQPQGQGPA